jgi:hypothetical protein
MISNVIIPGIIGGGEGRPASFTSILGGGSSSTRTGVIPPSTLTPPASAAAGGGMFAGIGGSRAAGMLGAGDAGAALPADGVPGAAALPADGDAGGGLLSSLGGIGTKISDVGSGIMGSASGIISLAIKVVVAAPGAPGAAVADIWGGVDVGAEFASIEADGGSVRRVWDEYSKKWVLGSPVTSATVYTAPITQPFKPSSTGLAAYLSNAWGSASETLKQLTPDFLPPPSFGYEGPVGGAGFLGLVGPDPDSQEYKQFVERQRLNEFNSKKSGIAPLADNAKTAAVEFDKQTVGPSAWEKFMAGFRAGYTEKPEDVNVFTESVKNAGNAMAGVVSPTSYPLILIGGAAILVLILIIK